MSFYTSIIKCFFLSQIEVEFELKDVNDFAPTFKPTNQYSASISEVWEFNYLHV